MADFWTGLAEYKRKKKEQEDEAKKGGEQSSAFWTDFAEWKRTGENKRFADALPEPEPERKKLSEIHEERIAGAGEGASAWQAEQKAEEPKTDARRYGQMADWRGTTEPVMPEIAATEPKTTVWDRLTPEGILKTAREAPKERLDAQRAATEAARQGTSGIRNTMMEDWMAETEPERNERMIEEAYRRSTVGNEQWLASLRPVEEIEAELDEARKANNQAGAASWLENAWNALVGNYEAANVLPESNKPREAQNAKAESEGRVKELEDELATAMWAKYESQRYKDDFAEKSGYQSTANGKELKYNPATDTYNQLPFDDAEYEYVNGVLYGETAANVLANEKRHARDGNPFAPVPKEFEYTQLADMTADEKALYNYIYATQGRQAGHEYLEYLRSDLYARQAEREKAESAAYAKEHPVLSTLKNVALAPAKGWSYLGQGLDYLFEGKIDENAPYNRMVYLPQEERATVTKLIEDNWGGFGTFAYGVGTSMLEFLWTNAVAGGYEPLALALMGTGAAADATVEAKERGLSDGQAYALGTIAGFAEIITEKVSIENLFSGKWETEPLRYLIKNTVAEGSEEGASDLINWFADILVAGDKGEWKTAINEYMRQGMSEDEAFRKALLDKGGEILLDVASGALSGFLMAAGPSAVGGAQKRADRSADIEAAREARKAADTGKTGVPGIGLPTAERPQGQAIMLPTAEEAEAGAPVLRTAEEIEAERAGAPTVAEETAAGKPAGEARTEEAEAKAAAKTAETREAEEPADDWAVDASEPAADGTYSPRESGRFDVREQSSSERDGVKLADLDSSTLKFGSEAQTEGIQLRTAAETEREAEIRRAEESGNVTRATGLRYGIDEKTIRKAEQMSQMTGHRVQFYSGQARSGAVENGFTNTKTGDIYMNKNTKKRFEFVFGHEFTHNLEGTDAYRALMDHIKSRAAEQGMDWLRRRADMRALYERGTGETLTDEQIDEEIAADWIGDNLSDESAIREICRDNPSVGKRIRDALDGFLVRAGNIGGIVTPYEQKKYENIIGMMDRYIGEANENFRRQAEEAAAESETTEEAETAEKETAQDRAERAETRESTGTGEKPTSGRNAETARTGAATRTSEAARGTAADRAEQLRARTEERYDAGEITDEEYDETMALADEMESTGLGYDSGAVEDDGPRGKIAEIVDRVRGRRSLSAITPEEDEAYLEAVRSGDTETAQRMVDEAAARAMPKSKVVDDDGNLKAVYHVTPNEFNVFDKSRLGEITDANASDEWMAAISHVGFWFNSQDLTQTPKTARWFPGWNAKKVFLNISDPTYVGTVDELAAQIEDTQNDLLERYGEDDEDANDMDFVMQVFRGRNGDGVIVSKDYEMGGSSYVVYEPEQIKSAEPVTYDDDGEPIKLSERFNEREPDIRWSMSEEERTFEDEDVQEAYRDYMSVEEDPEFEEIVEKAAYDGNEDGLLPRERNVYQYLRDRYGADAGKKFLHIIRNGTLPPSKVRNEFRRDETQPVRPRGEDDLSWMTGADRRRAYEGAEQIVQAALRGISANVDPASAVYRRFIKDVGYPAVEEILRRQEITADDVLDAIGGTDLLYRQTARGFVEDALERVRGMLQYRAEENPENARAEHPNNLTQSEADARLERLIDQFYAPALPAETEGGTETETESELPPETERSTKLFEGDPLDWMTQVDKNEVYFRAQKFTAEILKATDAVRRADMKEQTERRNKKIGIPTAEKLLRGQEVTAEEILEGLQSLGKKVKNKGKFLEFVDSRIGNLQKWLGYVREESLRNAAERPIDYKELKSKAFAEVRSAEKKLTDTILGTIGREMKFNMLEYRQFRQDIVRPLIESVLREETPDVGKALTDAGVDIAQQAAVADEIRGALTEAAEQLDDVRRNVMRQEEDRQRTEARNAELDARIPDDDEGLIQIAEAYKAQQRQWNRTKANNFVSDDTKNIAHKLATGQISEDDAHMQSRNWSTVKQLADAERAYNEAEAVWGRYTKRLASGWKTEADKALRDADAMNAKDKKAGLQYMTETFTRNVRDVFGEYADVLLDTYVRPIAASEAESTRFKKRYVERVNALNLGQKAAKGNLNSESFAVQYLGEAEDNVRVLELIGDPKAVRDGKNLTEWKSEIEAFKAANPNLNYDKVHAAIKEFAQIYDELIKRMNAVLVRNGYLPVNVRRGYFPHFTAGSDGVLAKFGQLLGIGLDSQALPTSINGLTDKFKPGKSWFGHALERTGFKTDYGAIQGYAKYLSGVADVIFQTENIRKLRALAAQIRYNFGDEGLREQIRKIESDDTKDEAQKLTEIANINEKGKFQLSQFVSWLDEYTNLLANKKAKLDRWVESTIGRKWYGIFKNINSRAAANMISGNLGSALTNFIPLNQAVSTIGMKYVLKGAYDTMTNKARHDGFADWSDFLTSRRGVDPLVRNNLDTLSDWLSKPMNLIDDFTSETIVRAAYARYRSEGLDMDSAMQAANETAAGLMADRSKGAMPTIFEVRNPLVKLVTAFQLEVNNEFRVLAKDIPKGVYRSDKDKKQAAALIAWTILRYFIGAHLFNDLYEKLVGRRSALDPIELLNDAIGDFSGKKLNNAFDMLTEGVFEDTKRLNPVKGMQNLRRNALEELPFVGGILGGGRVPVGSAFPDWENLENAAFNENWSLGKRLETGAREIGGSIGAYLLPPFGGGLGKKIVQTAENVIEGGRYKRDNSGEKQLQYPYYTDSVGETIGTVAQSMLFGPTGTEGGREWVENDFNTLSAKKTKVYEMLQDDFGEDRRTSYDLITTFYKILPTYDADGNGTIKQSEVTDALEGMTVPLTDGEGALQGLFGGSMEERPLTREEKAVLWQSYNKAWKPEKNPFDPKIGAEVFRRLNGGNEEE